MNIQGCKLGKVLKHLALSWSNEIAQIVAYVVMAKNTTSTFSRPWHWSFYLRTFKIVLRSVFHSRVFSASSHFPVVSGFGIKYSLLIYWLCSHRACACLYSCIFRWCSLPHNRLSISTARSSLMVHTFRADLVNLWPACQVVNTTQW